MQQILNYVTNISCETLIQLTSVIKKSLGFVHCAALNQIARDYHRFKENPNAMETSIEMFKSRMLDIYQRDCGEFFASNPVAVKRMAQFLTGISTLRHRSWEPLVVQKGKMYFLRCPVFASYLAAHLSFDKNEGPHWVINVDQEGSIIDHLIWIYQIIPIYQAILDNRWNLPKYEDFASTYFLSKDTEDYRKHLNEYKGEADKNNHTADLMYTRVIAFHDGCLDLHNLQTIAALCVQYYGKGEPGRLIKFWEQCMTFIEILPQEELEGRQKVKKSKQITEVLQRLNIAD
jgi:hypothetical protein